MSPFSGIWAEEYPRPLKEDRRESYMYGAGDNYNFKLDLFLLSRIKRFLKNILSYVITYGFIFILSYLTTTKSILVRIEWLLNSSFFLWWYHRRKFRESSSFPLFWSLTDSLSFRYNWEDIDETISLFKRIQISCSLASPPTQDWTAVFQLFPDAFAVENIPLLNY